MNRQPRILAAVACLAFALAGTGCTAGGAGPPATAAATAAVAGGGPAVGGPVIAVGSFNFPESVILLFTTDPAIAAQHLVVLADNRGLQPAENIVPVLRRATADRYGPGLLAALDAVSARLTTAALTGLDAEVELGNRDPRIVARQWLRAAGLARPYQ